ncbi:MAG: GNAT family N-acetyltransferase [Chloroflexota bacterium]
MSNDLPKQQLKMQWPEHLLNSPPDVQVPDGYILRTYQPGDEPGFYRVMDLAGFTNWDDETLRPWLSKILPDGWFLVVHEETRKIVATAMTNHNPSDLHPFAGELGWVAGHPEHKGKGLGMAVCGSVVSRLLQGGYEHIYLNTDDWRLPAITVYLRLGWVPFLYAPDMEGRWKAVCQNLDWPFTPHEWPHAPEEARSTSSPEDRAILPNVQPQDVGLSPRRLKRIQSAMQRHVDDGVVPGLLTMLVRHGQVGYVEGFGMADIETAKPIQEDTIFRLQSMSKPVTCAAVMMLYEEGYFKLSDPVSNFIPEFRDIHVGIDQVNEKSGKTEMELVTPEREMTIHHLLTHRSGLVYPNPEGSTAERLLGDLFEKQDPVEDAGGNTVHYRTADETLHQWIQRLTKVPLAHHPGTTMHYGLSIDVLGYLVEVLSGHSFDAFLKKRIFEPLGMKDTDFYVPSEKIERLSTMYCTGADNTFQVADRGETSSWAKPKKFLSGGGGPGWGLVGTAPDYARFAQMLLNNGELDGERLLSRKTVEIMTINHLPADTHLTGFAGYGLGLGFWRMMDFAQAQRMSSPGSFGWDGGAGTRFWIDPQEKMICMIMAQYIGGPWVAQEQFPVLAYQAIDD